MIGDAQAESERIVHDFQSYAIAYAEGDTRAFGTYAQRRSELVAALAAAIEVAEHVDMSPTLRGHIPDRGSTRKLLAEQVDALSALRARPGEET